MKQLLYISCKACAEAQVSLKYLTSLTSLRNCVLETNSQESVKVWKYVNFNRVYKCLITRCLPCWTNSSCRTLTASYQPNQRPLNISPQTQTVPALLHATPLALPSGCPFLLCHPLHSDLLFPVRQSHSSLVPGSSPWSLTRPPSVFWTPYTPGLDH